MKLQPLSHFDLHPEASGNDALECAGCSLGDGRWGCRLCGRTALCFGCTWALGRARLPSTPSTPVLESSSLTPKLDRSYPAQLLSAVVLRVLSGTKDTPASMTSTSSEGGSLWAHVSQAKVYAMAQAGQNSE